MQCQLQCLTHCARPHLVGRANGRWAGSLQCSHASVATHSTRVCGHAMASNHIILKVVASIVSLIRSTASKMQLLGNLHLSSVLDELDDLSAGLEDESEEDDGDEVEQESVGAQSQATNSGSRGNISLDAKYNEVWGHRKLLLAATFFPMSHEETQAIMHCATQAATDTRQGALQNFLDAQVGNMLSPEYHEENAMVMGVVDTMLDSVEDAVLHIRHITLDKARIYRSTAFIEELKCSAIYEPLQECILGQFRGGSHMVGMADGKHLFETYADDHGFLYVGMCSLIAAQQASLAGIVVTDDKEPKWAEDGAAMLAGSKAYREDWHCWMDQLFGDDVPKLADLALAGRQIGKPLGRWQCSSSQARVSAPDIGRLE